MTAAKRPLLSKTDAKVEEVMHKINVHLDKIKKKLERKGRVKLCRAIERRHTQLAIRCMDESSSDGRNGTSGVRHAADSAQVS